MTPLTPGGKMRGNVYCAAPAGLTERSPCDEPGTTAATAVAMKEESTAKAAKRAKTPIRLAFIGHTPCHRY